MSIFTGRLVEIGIGKESPRGTGVAATYWIPKTAITFDDKVSKAMSAGSYGHISDAPFTGYVVTKYGEGNIEGEINVNSFGLLLLALLGTDTPGSAQETVVFPHDYTIQNDNQCDSLSIHVKDSIGSVRFRMAMLNSMTIDVALGEFVKYTTNFISKFHQDEATQSPTYSIDSQFVHPDLTFKVGTSVGSLGNKISVKRLSLTIDKTVERMDMCGTLEPEDVVNKGIKITGTIELNYEDRTWRDYLLNGNIRAMQIQLASTKIIGTTLHPTLNMIFPKVHFSTWESARGLGDIASQTVNFEVMLDVTASPARLWTTFQLLNTIASY